MIKSKIQSPKSKINSNIKSQITKQKFCHLSFVLWISFVICALLFVINVGFSFAQSISSSQLINNAAQYDGRVVVYEGEVIGDVMQRGDFAWINVNDGQNAIGIWVAAPLARLITYTGSFKSKGDGVEVVGMFQRACPEHGGDLDIHAQTLRKTASGRMVRERLNLSKRNLAITLLGILFFIWILTLLKRK